MKLLNIGVRRNHEGSMFGDLPFDLHLHVFSFTDLGEIIALRKTCKLFLFITSQRIIWVDLLRRVCSNNSVFKPTFPIDEMSVIDLEQAVFAPTRWLNQVMNHNTDAIRSSRRMRTITPPENPYFQGVYLVPGGRFLITCSYADLCIWDLGYSSSSILSNAPIASAPHVFNDIFSVFPTADELGLRIFAGAICETNGWADEASLRDEFWIFEIYPLSEKPALSKIASIRIEDFSEVTLFSFRGDLLIYQGANYVKVWNFVTDMGVTFNVDGELLFRQLCVTEESIILVRASMVSIWNIPPLTPGGHIENPGQHFVTPNLGLAVDFDMDFEEGEELQFEMPSEWYTHHSITCDIIYESDKTRKISRYEVILPERLVKLQNRFVLLDKGPGMTVEPYRFCNGTLVMCWSDSQSVMASSLSREQQKTDDIWEPEDITLLCDEEGLVHAEFTLCPVAGRLCHISRMQDSIIIFDYLAPPPS